MKVKSESEVAQSCPTLSDPMDCSLPGSSVHGIFQAKYWSGVPLPSPENSMKIPLKKKGEASPNLLGSTLSPSTVKAVKNNTSSEAA